MYISLDIDKSHDEKEESVRKFDFRERTNLKVRAFYVYKRFTQIKNASKLSFNLKIIFRGSIAQAFTN